MSILTMIKFLRKDPGDPVFIFTFIISIVAIATALFTEFYLGYAPCALCIYERIPYLVLAKISFWGFWATRFDRFWKICICLTFVTAIGLSGYHTGVERGWLNASKTCNPELHIPEKLSDAEAIELMKKQPIATCSVAPFKVLTFSMTEWNLLLNLALLIIMILRLKVKL